MALLRLQGMQPASPWPRASCFCSGLRSGREGTACVTIAGSASQSPALAQLHSQLSDSSSTQRLGPGLGFTCVHFCAIPQCREPISSCGRVYFLQVRPGARGRKQ